MSEKFKTMQEVRVYVESLKPHLSAEDYELFLYLYGLLDNRGDSETIIIEGAAIKIDKFLIPMIEELNQVGVKTLACCSGLQAEHLEGRFRPETGYLSIAFDSVLFDSLMNISNEIISIQKSECYLKPCVLITLKSKEDSVLKENWLFVWNVLKRIYNIN